MTTMNDVSSKSKKFDKAVRSGVGFLAYALTLLTGFAAVVMLFANVLSVGAFFAAAGFTVLAALTAAALIPSPFVRASERGEVR